MYRSCLFIQRNSISSSSQHLGILGQQRCSLLGFALSSQISIIAGDYSGGAFLSMVFVLGTISLFFVHPAAAAAVSSLYIRWKGQNLCSLIPLHVTTMTPPTQPTPPYVLQSRGWLSGGALGANGLSLMSVNGKRRFVLLEVADMGCNYTWCWYNSSRQSNRSLGSAKATTDCTFESLT